MKKLNIYDNQGKTMDRYTVIFHNGDIYAMLREGVDPSVLKEVNLECEDCQELLSEWSKKTDKRMY